jgi:hypothetical protein
MIRKIRSPKPEHVRVIFELPSCIWADRIFLTGDFNGWDQSDIPMRQDRNGVWQAVLDLPVGARYEFLYVIDGQWRTDSHADGYAHNSYGSQNSIVVTELLEVVPHSESTSSLVHEEQVPRTITSGRLRTNVIQERLVYEDARPDPRQEAAASVQPDRLIQAAA